MAFQKKIGLAALVLGLSAGCVLEDQKISDYNTSGRESGRSSDSRAGETFERVGGDNYLPSTHFYIGDAGNVVNPYDGGSDGGHIDDNLADADGYPQSDAGHLVGFDANSPEYDAGNSRFDAGQSADSGVSLDGGSGGSGSSLDANYVDAGIDGGCEKLTAYYDYDGDGYASRIEEICRERLGQGYTTSSLGEDCNDRNSQIHTDAEELCDNLNNDCDEQTDEDLVKLVDCPLAPLSEYHQACHEGVWEDLDLNNCPECTEGKTEKVECETDGPCKGYQTRECVDGFWDWSGCIDRILLSEALSGEVQISGDKVAMLSYLWVVDSGVIQQKISRYNLSEGVLEDKLILEAGEHWIYGLSDFKNDKALISGYFQNNFVFDFSNDQLTTIIFSPGFEINEEIYHPFCQSLNGNSVFCTEQKKPHGYTQNCIVEHSAISGEEIKDYCEELSHYNVHVNNLVAGNNKIVFSGLGGEGKILGIFDLNNREITIVDNQSFRCGVHMYIFKDTHLVYSFSANPDCAPGIPIKPETVYSYNLETRQTENITEKSGLQCVLYYADVYGNNLSCLTSYVPDFNLHLINLNTGNSALIAEGSGNNSLSGNKLVYESNGEILLCELKDEWNGE